MIQRIKGGNICKILKTLATKEARQARHEQLIEKLVLRGYRIRII